MLDICVSGVGALETVTDDKMGLWVESSPSRLDVDSETQTPRHRWRGKAGRQIQPVHRLMAKGWGSQLLAHTPRERKGLSQGHAP